MKGRSIPGSVCPAAQSLTSVGKTIHEIREEQIELHHHGIDREDDSPLTGTSGGEVEVHGHQAERAKEDVAINLKKLFVECGEWKEERNRILPLVYSLSSKQSPVIVV